MMRFKSILVFACMALLLFSCNNKSKDKQAKEAPILDTLSLLVDESFSRIIDDQVTVFNSDHPNATIKQVIGNEKKIIPAFLNDSIRVMVSSRMLTPDEEKFYERRKIRVSTDRFAIDGIALITNKAAIDSNITVQEVIDILKGVSKSGKTLVFDNAYSATLRYFMDLAKIEQLPKSGVSALQSSEEVIKFIAARKDYIGVIGVNWLYDNSAAMSGYLRNIMLMNVKNLPGLKGDKAYYKPIQKNLISGIYPFLRNIYIINAEDKKGLGTRFATWLTSQRGQLIVLKSGLGPHKLVSRDFNLKSNN